MSLEDADEKMKAWRRDDNQHRPHGAIGNKVPIMLTKPGGITSPSPRAKSEDFTFRRSYVGGWIRLEFGNRRVKNASVALSRTIWYQPYFEGHLAKVIAMQSRRPTEQALADALLRARHILPGIRALLFDLDGTLVDTMDLHYRAYRQIFAEAGGDFRKADFDDLVGPPAGITIPLFLRAAGLDVDRMPTVAELHARKKQAFARLVEDHPLKLLSAAELLCRVSGDVAIAVVTSGNSHGAQTILTAAGLTPMVTVLVTGDDVERGKPAPDPYALALSRLGCMPNQGLAFEDHDDGILSASRAGLMVIDVRTGEMVLPCPA